MKNKTLKISAQSTIFHITIGITWLTAGVFNLFSGMAMDILFILVVAVSAAAIIVYSLSKKKILTRWHAKTSKKQRQ